MSFFPLLRNLLRTPGETTLAMLALGAGMGLTTTLFSIVKGVLWTTLPVPNVEELVRVDTSPEDLPALLAQQTNFRALGGITVSGANGVVEGNSRRLQIARVSPKLFSNVLQAKPSLGTPELAIAPARTALISYALWRDGFRSRADILGKHIRVENEDVTIVGVMAAHFAFPRNEDVWVAWEHSAAAPVAGWSFLVGRLNAGATVEAAKAEVNVISRRLHASQTAEAPLPVVAVIPYSESNVKGEIRIVLMAILTCCFFVLLIACANVANLSLARAARRLHELGLRCALGASRTQLIRMLLAENLVLALGGALMGILFATGALSVFVRYLQAEAPLTGGAPAGIEYDIDGRVLAFVSLLTIATALVSGLAPALRATSLDLEHLIRSGAKSITLRSGRFGAMLIHVQLAASVLLLIGTGMMGSMLVQLGSQTGYDPSKIWNARVELPRTEYANVMAALQTTRAVEAAGLTTAEHIERTYQSSVTSDRAAAGRSVDSVSSRWQAVTSGYFAVFGSELRAGRLFDGRDTADATKVAIVNRSFARRNWRDADPVGRRFRRAGSASNAEWFTVVGVVDDIGSLKAGPARDLAAYYVPLTQFEAKEVSVAIRTRNDVRDSVPQVMRVLRAIPGAPPVFQAHTAAEIMDMEAIGIRVPALLFGLCGVSGLLLSAVGTYGVLSLAARQRTREIGIRMALGAAPGMILKSMLVEGSKQVGIGIGAGLLLGLVLTQVLASLFGSLQWQLGVNIVVAVIMACVGLAAIGIPAHGASRLQPHIALRD
ncbi:MAG TPA: ABC transporter permease [Bryobacteraceae bacterium]|nr:ABC transporter permease [Bryobacteraceae bacterium]